MIAFREMERRIWTREQLEEIGAAEVILRLLRVTEVPDRIEVSPLQADIAIPIRECYRAWEARQPSKAQAWKRLQALAPRPLTPTPAP